MIGCFEYPRFALLMYPFMCHEYKSFCISFISNKHKTKTKDWSEDKYFCKLVGLETKTRKNYLKSLQWVENKNVETKHKVFYLEKHTGADWLICFCLMADAYTTADVDYRWKGGDDQGIEIVSAEMAQFDLTGVKTRTKSQTNSKGETIERNRKSNTKTVL